MTFGPDLLANQTINGNLISSSHLALSTKP